MRSVAFLILSVLMLSAEAKSKNFVEAKMLSNCGDVVSVRVTAETVEVIYHPENAPPIDKGGNNRGEIFDKKFFDPNLITTAAYQVMNNHKLLFCGGVESSDKSKIEPGFWITLKK